MHTGCAGSGTRAGRHGKAPRRNHVTAEQFRDARVFGGLTREQAADLLGVSLRTIGHWETGRTRPAWAAFKLLRVFRHGVMPDPAWDAYRIIRGKLVTPEGHAIEPHEVTWLSLLVRRARAFSDLLQERNSASTSAPQARRALGLSLTPSKEKNTAPTHPPRGPISRGCDTVAGERDESPGQSGVPFPPFPSWRPLAGTLAPNGGAA